MLSFGSKSLFWFGAFALVAALAYGGATNEGSGATLLAFTAAAAILLGLVGLLAGIDRPVSPAPEGVLEQRPPAGSRPLFPSIWPLACALAVGGLAVGVATTRAVILPSLVVGAIVGVGWLAQTWSEHPVFTARFGTRLSDRLIVPLALPVTVFVLVATIAVSLSRILLAVSEQGSRIVAISFALLVLVTAFIVASREQVARAALRALVAVALTLVVAAGAVGFAHGERHFTRETGAPASSPAVATGTGSGAPGVVTISAHTFISFDSNHLSFPANKPVSLVFDNSTLGVPHNVGIYTHQGGTELFTGKIITGDSKITYAVQPLQPGTYYFQCDVHPNMHGTLTVEGAG